MANNRDLLREAIADAKAVKETAIANAKAALTESFTPFLKEKLSQKISEMEEGDMNLAEMDEMMYGEADDNNEGLDEISLDELLAELEESPAMEEELYEAKKDEKDEEMSLEDMSEDDLKSFIEDVIKDMVSAGELETGNEEEDAEIEADEEEDMPEEEELADEEADEEVDLEELLAEMNTKESSDELEEAKRKKAKKEEEDTKEEELEEAYGVIKHLKSELNEINLLNAKLLYTNKIFRSKSLTESQKIKVLTAFDKAKTKKEAQLVYETLTEGLKVSITKTSIKESLGSASKSLGNAIKKPIIENDAFARMRELAGLKK